MRNSKIRDLINEYNTISNEGEKLEQLKAFIVDRTDPEGMVVISIEKETFKAPASVLTGYIDTKISDVDTLIKRIEKKFSV